LFKNARCLDTFATALGLIQVLIAESWGTVCNALLQGANHLGIAIGTIGTGLLLANILGMRPPITNLLGKLRGLLELILHNAQVLGRYWKITWVILKIEKCTINDPLHTTCVFGATSSAFLGGLDLVEPLLTVNRWLGAQLWLTFNALSGATTFFNLDNHFAW